MTFFAACWPLAASAATPHERFTPGTIVNADAHYPEGPQLVDNGLLVAEMPLDRIVLVTGASQPKQVWQRTRCGPTSIKRIPSGGFWVLCHLGGYVVRLGANFETVQTYGQTTAGRRITWPNDGSIDAEGNLYLSSSGLFALDAPAEGRVVFIDVHSGVASDIATGIHYSNGVLVQERQKRVLVSETLNRRVLAFPLLGKAHLGPSSTFFDFRNAPAVADAYVLSGPDGIAAFGSGDIVVADYGNGRFLLLSEDGRFLEQVPLKYRFVTNFAIVPDQHTIYVTMTRDNASEALDGIVQAFNVN